MTSAQAGSLKCPNCGAPSRSAGASRCDYCRATLATVSCPSCFGLLFDGAAFCPHCGSARSRAEGAGTERVPCPACKGGRMTWVKVGETDLLECGTCDGTWIEAAAFERICTSHESQAAVLHTSGAAAAVSTRAPVRYRKCPSCRKMMNRINFGRSSGAVVDVCKGHGTFLDRGELHQIVRFIQAGGIDRARAAELQRLSDEQRRLRDLQRDQARVMAPSSTAKWNDASVGNLLSAVLRGLVGGE